MLMLFDLQRFAEGEAGADAADANANTPSEAPATNSTPPPTEKNSDDVQSKIDAAIAKTKAEVKAEMEAEFKKREAAAKREAERLSKLSDDERQKAELENTRRELEQQKAAFETEKIRYEAARVLGQRGLPVEFTDYLIADSNAATLDRIKTFEKHYRKAIEDAVNSRLKGKAPASGGKSVDADGKGDNTGAFMDAIRSCQIKPY